MPNEEEFPVEEVGDAISIFKHFQKWLYTPGLTEINLSLSGNLGFEAENGKITQGLSFGLYPNLPTRNQEGRYHFIEIQRDVKKNNFSLNLIYQDILGTEGEYWGEEPIDFKTYTTTNEGTIAYKIFNLFRNRIYRFHAERLNVGSCSYGKNSELKADASNLAEVLHLLPNKDPQKFNRFNNYILTIFPQIAAISVPAKDDSTVEIRVWSIEAAKNSREDLTFPLSACGTGISQVLAILYVVLTSQYPRTIIIDEPQSFLHPGAAKKLVEIL